MREGAAERILSAGLLVPNPVSVSVSVLVYVFGLS